MLKSRSSWNLVLLPTSNTKEGERGVLKAPRLDQEEGQLIQLLDHASKATNKLVSSHLETLLVLGQATGNIDSFDSPRPELGEATTFPHIVFSTLLNRTYIRMALFQRRSPENILVWTPKTLGVHISQLRPPIGMRSEANLQLSSRAFQRCVALHLHAPGLGRFPTFNGRESNRQFDSWPFFLSITCAVNVQMAHARPFLTSTLQDLSNGIKNTSIRGVLTPAIKL